MGITFAILMKAMGTQSLIISAIGVLGLLFAGTGVYLAMDAWRDRAYGAFTIGLLIWVSGELFVIPSEYNLWSATVTARAEREMDLQREANGRRLILDTTATKLANEKPDRSSRQVQSAIDKALAAPLGKKTTLAAATHSCADIAAPSYRYCSEVLKLREEKARAEDFEKDSSLVWDANTRLAVDTSAMHGTHDGVASFAELVGKTPKFWSIILTLLTMLVLFLGRGVTLFVGHRDAKSERPCSVPVAKAVTVTKEHSVTEVPKPIAASVPELPLPKPISVTELPAPKPASVPLPAAEQKQPAAPDLTNVAFLNRNVPKTLNPTMKRIDPIEAEYQAIVDEMRSGHAISPAEARKRVNRVAVHNGQNTAAQRAVGKRLREIGNKVGVRIEANNGRRYAIAGVGRAKEAARLGVGVA